MDAASNVLQTIYLWVVIPGALVALWLFGLLVAVTGTEERLRRRAIAGLVAGVVLFVMYSFTQLKTFNQEASPRILDIRKCTG